MTLTPEQIEALSHEERDAVWGREFSAECERIRALLPRITAFCREHDIRYEIGPDYGMTVMSTRPVSAGGSEGWVEATWDFTRSAYVEVEGT